MIEQVTGATTALVLILAYVLIVQAMMAAIVVLAEFIALRLQALRNLVRAELSTENDPEPAGDYRLGGGLLKW
jgi:hypothetical protein